MSNILKVDDTEITLIGFTLIEDKAYFVLRNSGIFIMSKEDEITAQVISCEVINGKIYNERLIKELKYRGFDSNLFGKIRDSYYCENPKDN